MKQSGAERSLLKETAHEHKKQLSVRDLREKRAQQYCVICGRGGRIEYRASRRGTAKVAPALCRRSKLTDVQKQGVPRETTLQSADDLPVTCR